MQITRLGIAHGNLEHSPVSKSYARLQRKPACWAQAHADCIQPDRSTVQGYEMNQDLAEPLLRFIESTIPTYQAAEVLLFLTANPEKRWDAGEIVVGMRPVVITLPAVKEYLALFKTRGILTEKDGTFRYQPSSPELESEVGALAHLYAERPVTLINTIYRLAERRIQSFADSFKLRKE